MRSLNETAVVHCDHRLRSPSELVWCIAQRQSDQTRRIGLLIGTAENDPVGRQQMMGFRSALETLGWADGRNISLVLRWSGGEPSRANQYARELVDLAPDLIIANSTIGLEAVRSATRKIPIVFIAVTDPVAAGYVESMARPGGNITGFSSFDAETGGKWLEIINEFVPAVTRVGS
jgi:putative tryptophan/tyrosine transport system substrate-binding protein